MKKLFFKSAQFFLLLAVLSVSLVSAVSAAGYGLDKTGGAAGFGSANDSLFGEINIAVRIGLGLLGFVFFGYTLYAGLRWMLARGNAEFVEKAQRTLEASIIGLVIVVLAYALANFILKKIGG